MLYEAYSNITRHLNTPINASMRKHHDLGFNKCSFDSEYKSLTKEDNTLYPISLVSPSYGCAPLWTTVVNSEAPTDMRQRTHKKVKVSLSLSRKRRDDEKRPQCCQHGFDISHRTSWSSWPSRRVTVLKGRIKCGSSKHLRVPSLQFDRIFADCLLYAGACWPFPGKQRWPRQTT